MESRDFSKEFVFKTSRSGGPGGQNVNKVETKVELIFDVDLSPQITDDEKKLIHKNLSTRIKDDGKLHISSSSERSQLKNKEKVIEKFLQLLDKALKPKKKRKPTKISAAQKEARLKSKKENSLKKEMRRKIE